METIRIKRIYEKASPDDGYRILVDRLWPRGISKEVAQLDEWDKEIAPSAELRKWFDHKAERFNEFSLKYRLELKEKGNLTDALKQTAKKKTITLLYAAKDPEINQAIILKDVLLGKD